MPIAATKLQYETRKKINRINSDFAQAITVADLDSYLNEAKDALFENYAALAETNTTIRNHLRQLEVKKVCLPCTKQDKKCCKITYPEGFYRLLSQTTKACKGDCGERDLVTHIIQSNELSTSLKDPFWSPSWDYEETLADEAGDGLYVYHQDFDIKEVCIDYLRKPKDIATPSLTKKGSYRNAEGQTVATDQPLELDATFLWRKVVDIAALMVERDMSELTDYQSQLQKIMAVDKMFLN